MRNNFISRVAAKASLLLFLLIPAAVFSQIAPITITSPTYSAVYQQDTLGYRTVTITGTFTVPMDKIEVRAVPVLDGQGVETAWSDLQLNPKGGVFKGNIDKLRGGWYTVEVRGTSAGKVVGRGVLQRLGVGEVFIISGQSNAQGLKAYPGPSAVDDRVIYISNYENDQLGMYNDLLTDPVPPVFSKLSNVKTISPRGQTAWCWGILGDLLVAKLGVPVLFINTAWEGTSVDNWAESAQGLPTSNKYGGSVYTPGMPYANLRIAARNYANQYGVRSILWMQGETDGLFATPAAKYRDELQFLINRLGSETGKRIVWTIARTSRTSPSNSIISKAYPTVIAAQNAVLDTPFNPTYPGPETDALYTNRGDGTHFVGKSTADTEGTKAALTILANAWNSTLDANFFSTVTPITPAEIPAITASCVTANNAVTISLPTGYASYLWNTGATGNTITVSAAGTYRATVKDASGNSTLSSVVVLDNNAKPAQPTIVQQGQQQACADSAFTFSVSGNDIYSWYKAGSTVAIANGSTAKFSETGSYQVKAQNIFGCVSDNSASASLLIRPKISKPVIVSSGPFSATASITETGLNEKYLWRLPNATSDTIATNVKILKSGIYSTKAQVVYTLGNNSLTCYSDTTAREFKTNEENEIVIYPNPSQGNFIYVESRDNVRDASITLFDIFGRVVKTTAPKLLNSRLQLDVSNLAAGKYILKVTGQDQSLTKQIIVR